MVTATNNLGVGLITNIVLVQLLMSWRKVRLLALRDLGSNAASEGICASVHVHKSIEGLQGSCYRILG